MRNTKKKNSIIYKHVTKVIFVLLLISLAYIITSSISSEKLINTPKFDKDKAFAFLTEQCKFGPRPLGTPAHELTRNYLIAELKKYTDQVSTQEFYYQIGNKVPRITNIIANFGDTNKPSILLCAHWDTRPTADEEKDPKKRKQAILGANDGASGVAVLLELARLFKQNPPKSPVTIILFDGEDYGPDENNMFIGSKYFANNYNKNQEFKLAILLDMVGDADLNIYRETYSQKYVESTNDLIWNTAKKSGYQKYFIDKEKYKIKDDHVPLLLAGIPCVNIIDFDYPYWHTLEDTVDKCSADSLQVVGDVITKVVYSN